MKRSIVSIILVLIFVVSCTPKKLESDSMDKSNLLDKLRNAASLEIVGQVEQSFLSPKGDLVKVNENDVQIYEYDSESSLESEAATISPDGSSVGTTIITWIDTPHFFKRGNVMVLYIGNDAATINLLEEFLGKQFAGRISNSKSITSFEGCVAAGNPVGESYPRQCWTKDGKRFVEEIEEQKTFSKQIDTGKGILTLEYSEDLETGYGKVVLSGILQRSTPCVDWNIHIGGTEDLPSSSQWIEVFDKNKGKICVQVVGEPQEIRETIKYVSERTKFTVKFEDQIVFEGKIQQGD